MFLRHILFVLVVVAFSCTDSPAVHGPSRLGVDAYRDRIALGFLGEALADPPRELARLKAIASFARRAGNREEALAASYQLVHASRRLLVVARAEHSGRVAVEDAETLHRDAQRFVITLGRELDEQDLILQALGSEVAIGSAQAKAYLEAALTLRWLADDEYASAHRLAAGDEDAQIELALKRPEINELKVDNQRLVAFGVRAYRLLVLRWEAGAAEGTRGELASAAHALLQIDPLHVKARITALYLRDLKAGVVRDDASLVPAIVGTKSDAVQVARLEQALGEQPAAESLALALAVQLQAAGLSGDAYALILSLQARGSLSTAATLVADQLLAISLLVAGDLSGYRRWSKRRQSERSPYMLLIEMGMTGSSEEDIWTVLAARARRQASALGLSLRSAWYLDRQLAIDHQTPTRLRRERIRAMRSPDRLAAAVADHCLVRRMRRWDCRRLLELVDALDEEEGLDVKPVAALRKLLTMDALPPSILWGLLAGTEPRDVAAMLPLLDQYQGSYMAASPAYVSLRLQAQLFAGHHEQAERFLEEAGALLAPGTRLAFRLAINDLRSGRAGGDEVLLALASRYEIIGPVRQREQYDDAWIAETYTGKGRVTAYIRGRSYLNSGNARAAVDALASLLGFGGPERGHLAGQVALAANAVGDDSIRDLAAVILQKDGKGALLNALLQAEQHTPGQPSRKAWAAVWKLQGSDTNSLLQYQAALAAEEGGKEGLRMMRELRTSADPQTKSQTQWMAVAFANERVRTGAQFAALLAAKQQPENLLLVAKAGQAALQEPAIATAMFWFFSEKLHTAKDAAAARQIAQEAATALVKTGSFIGKRASLSWLYFLAGQGKLARELAMNAGAADVEDTVMTPDAPLVMASYEREGVAAPISDDLAWRLWRHYDDGSGLPLQLAQELLDVSKVADGGLTLGCRLLIAADLQDEAVGPCFRAWKAGGKTTDLAAALSYLVVNRGELVAALGIDADTFFAELHTRVGSEQDAVWLQNEAIWLAGAGRDEEAAARAREAWQRGSTWKHRPHADDLRQARWRGTTLRIQMVEGYEGSRAGQMVMLSFVALLEGNLDAARFYLAARSSAGAYDDTEGSLAKMEAVCAGAIEIAGKDLSAKRLDIEGVGRWFRTLSRTGAEMSDRAFALRYPKSLALLALNVENSKLSMTDRAEFARKLLARVPGNLLVVSDQTQLLIALRDFDGARKVLADALVLHPNSVFLASIKLPAKSKPKDLALFRNHARFLASLAEVGDSEITALAPVRKVDLDEATSAFFASSTDADADDAVAHTSEAGNKSFVRSFARAAMCEGLACLAGIAESLEKQGFKEVWRHQATLPAGAGADLLVESESSFLLTTVIPVGGRLFALYHTGAKESLGQDFAALRLLRDSFRPLDRWISAPAAEALRNRQYDAGKAPSYQVLAELRSASTHTGCPIGKLLKQSRSPSVRGQILLEAALAAATVEERARIIRCVAPSDAASARLGFLALLSEDSSEFNLGRAITKSYPGEVALDANLVFLAEDSSALSAASRQSEIDLAPLAILQVLAVLPVRERQALSGLLLRSADEGKRSLALIAAGVIKDAVTGDVLRSEIRNGPASSAALAVWAAFFRHPGAEDIAATRKRLDALKGPLGPAERELLAACVLGLLSLVDSADEVRLRRAESLATKTKDAADAADAADADSGNALRSDIAKQRVRHTRAVELRKAKAPTETPLDSDDASAQALVAALVPTARASLPAVAEARLKADALPKLLDGANWNYVRVSQPGLFVATLRGLYRRLRGSTKLDTAMLNRIGSTIALNAGMDIFAEQGGLDLTKAIECATPGDVDAGFVCSVFVSNADAVRTTLAKRKIDHDSGIVAPMRIGEASEMLPLLAVAAPLALHGVLNWEIEDDEEPKIVAHERVRMQAVVAGFTLDHYRIAEANEHGRLRLDSEYYLFVGDRLLVFSNIGLASRVLSASPDKSESLAENAAFQASTASWREGATLQGIMLPGSESMLGDLRAIEIFVDQDGLQVRSPIGKAKDLADARALANVLPGSPVSRVTFGIGNSSSTADLSEMSDVLGDYDSKELGVAPPLWLFHHSEQASFGWYAPEQGKLWDQWVAVAALNRKMTKAMLKRRYKRAVSSRIVEHAGLFYTTRAGVLIMASTAKLVEQAIVVAAAPVADEPVYFRGEFAGEAFAEAMRAMAAKARMGTQARNVLSTFAIFASAMQSVSFGTVLDPGRGEAILEARIRPRLVEEGVDLDTVDQWLASPRIRNSATLPRAVSAEQLRRPISLLLKVKDTSSGFARAFAGVPRLKAEIVDATHLRITIQPGPMPKELVASAPMSAAERKNMLASTGLLNARHRRIKKLAASIVPKGSDPQKAASRVLDWIEKNIRYEITPFATNAIDVLDRKSGDCTEYSVLAVSLLRAAGVPAELRQGMAVQNSEMVAHNWIAFHDGTGWREVDPTAHTMYVGSGHIEASLLEFITLISVGGLEIESVVTTN